MKNYMDEFKQTGKTILFERFAEYNEDGKPASSLKLLLQEKNIQVDSFYKKVADKLGVICFEEFVEKFVPFVYEEVYTNPDTDEVRVSYTLEKPKQWDENKSPVSLDAQAFYQMIEELYQNRKNSGQPAIAFDYQSISRLICPKERQKRYKEIRASMEYYTQEYYRLEELEPGVPSREKNECAKQVQDARLELINHYQGGVAEILSLQLADAQALLIEQSKLAADADDEGSTGSFVRGMPSFDHEGNLKILPLEQKTDSFLESAGSDKNEPKVLLLETLKSDFENTVPELAKSEEITDLVLSAVSSAKNRNRLSTEVIQKRIARCETLYKEWNESLAETIAPLAEKFIGVRAFFDNATVDGKLDENNKLIVANCNAEELMQGEYAEKLERFLMRVNASKTEKIWFGIVPAVSLGDEVIQGKMKNLSPLSPLVELRPQEARAEGLVSAGKAGQLMDICAKARIMCFYNYKANENTSFSNLTKERFIKMREKIRFQDGSYAVCCLPNFTILPKDKTNIIINQTLLDHPNLKRLGLTPEPAAVQLPGIYIEASYIAAGMMAGVQQHKVLKERFSLSRIEQTLPGIRVDFEDKTVSYACPSNMCRESLLPCAKELEDEIMESRFGFFFSDMEVKNSDGKPVTCCYVRNARTMQDKDGRYRKLNHVLFADFIRMMIGGDRLSDKGNIDLFIENDARDWQIFQQKEDQSEDKVVNSLLRKGEKIEKSAEKPQINIIYGQDTDYVDIKVENAD